MNLLQMVLSIFSAQILGIIQQFDWLNYLGKSVLHVRSLDEPFDSATQYPILNFIGLVERHGYTAEEHIMTSPDGYILTLHRISGSPKCQKAGRKPVVYLQHGITLSSDSWVLIGPEKDLAFQLADDCKDVWVGNVRGNTYSQKHVNPNISESDFWKFSYHEMAVYDLKTFVDFILRKTDERDMTYIGFSMGTTMSYVFLSTYPEYNQKFNLVQSIAPVVYWKHPLRRVVSSLNVIWDPMAALLKYFEVNKVLPQNAVVAALGTKFCKDGDVFQNLCSLLISTIGLDRNRLNRTALPTILAHFPSGTSVTNIYSFNQNFVKQKFQAYDYGAIENIKKYGRRTPPTYDLSKVTAPISIWYAKNDDVVNYKDVEDLKKQLPNVFSYNMVENENFNHFDFLWARDVKELVYDYLVEDIILRYMDFLQ